jgi:hypothetical protein
LKREVVVRQEGKKEGHKDWQDRIEMDFECDGVHGDDDVGNGWWTD